MKAADGGKRGGRRTPTPSASASGQRPHPEHQYFNPAATLDPNQMEIRPPGHPGHKRGRTPR